MPHFFIPLIFFFNLNMTRGHTINFLSNDKILDMTKFKVLADDKINATEKLKFVLGQVGRKHYGKRRKCWLPAFSPFSNNVFKSLLFKGR